MGTTEHAATERFSAVTSLVAAMIGFGLIPIFLRYFTECLDAWTVNGVRYSIGALFWLPFLLFLEREPAVLDGNAGRGVWRDALVPSVVNIIGQAGFGLSAYFVSASMIGFVLRLSFLFTIVFGLLVLAEERLLARKTAFWAGAALSLLGVVVMLVDMYLSGDGAAAGSTAAGQRGTVAVLVGIGLLMVTSLAWGGYSVSVRYYMARYTARESFGVISLYTSAALVLLMFAFGNFRQLGSISGWIWLNLMLSALIGIAFGHVLYYRGIHRLGPVVASGILLVTPFVTFLVAAVILNESLSAVEWIGGMLVVFGGGFLVAARSQIEREAAPAPVDLDDQAGGQV